MYTPNSWDYMTYPHDPAPMYSLTCSPADIIIPQRPYSANIQRNHTHSIGPLEFITTQGKGIRLADVQARMAVGLLNADCQPLEGFGMKVTYRIEWPGYESFNKQKHALRATRQKQSVSLLKVALHVAEVMKDFIQEMAPLHSDDPNWRVGQGFIDFDDLYLLEVHQVAKASLQPVIAYRPRAMIDSPIHYPTGTYYHHTSPSASTNYAAPPMHWQGNY